MPADRIQRITTADDPRLAVYRGLKDRVLVREHGLFICEGEHLVRRMLASPLAAHSILATEARAAALREAAPPQVPVYAASPEMLGGIVGYSFHRGVLGCGHRPADQGIDRLPPVRTLVVCPMICNEENLGLIVRTAAALGADALLLGERGADAFARRVVRVSMGAVFSLPIARSTDLLADLRRLRHEQAVELVATVLAEDAVPLHRYRRPPRVAVLLGGEAEGLDAAYLDLCDQRITIPMHRATDSLNVAVAAGVVLHHLVAENDEVREKQGDDQRPPAELVDK